MRPGYLRCHCLTLSPVSSVDPSSTTRISILRRSGADWRTKLPSHRSIYALTLYAAMTTEKCLWEIRLDRKRREPIGLQMGLPKVARRLTGLVIKRSSNDTAVVNKLSPTPSRAGLGQAAEPTQQDLRVYDEVWFS